MKKLLLYTTPTEDHIVYEFDENGILRGFEINKKLDEEQFSRFRKSLPYTEAELRNMVNGWKTAGVKCRLDEELADLSFDAFYLAYNTAGGEKRNRERALALWKKTPDAQKIRAIRYIKNYAVSCKNSGVAMKYPDTYLNNKTWND